MSNKNNDLSIVPRNGHVLVRAETPKKITEAGLHLPETARVPDSPFHVVVHAGGVEDLEAGDRLILGPHRALLIPETDPVRKIIHEDDILAKLG